MMITDEELGRVVRQAWINWANEQTNPKPSWLVGWEGLSRADQEADIKIGRAVAELVRLRCMQEVAHVRDTHRTSRCDDGCVLIMRALSALGNFTP